MSAIYDANEYLIAGLENQAEWWEHLGDAHRDYAALAREAVELNRITEMRRVEGKRILDERNTLAHAIQRYADTLILDQPLDETSPLSRAIVAHDLRSFLDFAANGGLLTKESSVD